MIRCCLEPDCLNLRSLAFCVAFCWLVGNVPSSQSALSCTLKGDKGSIEVDQTNGVSSCISKTLLQHSLLLCQAQKRLGRWGSCPPGWRPLSRSWGQQQGLCPGSCQAEHGAVADSRHQLSPSCSHERGGKCEADWVSAASCSTCFSQLLPRDY